jgi:hypothetical protein
VSHPTTTAAVRPLQERIRLESSLLLSLGGFGCPTRESRVLLLLPAPQGKKGGGGILATGEASVAASPHGGGRNVAVIRLLPHHRRHVLVAGRPPLLRHPQGMRYSISSSSSCSYYGSMQAMNVLVHRPHSLICACVPPNQRDFAVRFPFHVDIVNHKILSLVTLLAHCGSRMSSSSSSTCYSNSDLEYLLE